MQRVIFITHGNVIINKDVPVPDWGMSNEGVLKHNAFNNNLIIQNVTGVYSSNERKAVEGAQILAKHLGLAIKIFEDLHENGRTSTGFLPPDEFEKVADEFFSKPELSVRGWERAVDAQNRIIMAVSQVISIHGNKGDIAIVAHGGVGTLLLCNLLKVGISRQYDQTQNGGGNYFVFDAVNLNIIEKWRSIATLDVGN